MIALLAYVFVYGHWQSPFQVIIIINLILCDEMDGCQGTVWYSLKIMGIRPLKQFSWSWIAGA